MNDYRIERGPDGKPIRMWWIPPEERRRCACGAEAMLYGIEGIEPECCACHDKRTQMRYKGADPDCRYCGGRGCLACPQQ